MSSYEIDYGSLEGDAKREQAIRDIKSYLGDVQYEKISEMLRAVLAEGKDDDDTIRFTLAFAGVRGYPVTAWLETLRAEEK